MPGKIPLTRVYKKISAKTGAEYFVGRLGQSRLLIFRERDQPEDGDEVFAVFVEAIEETQKPAAPRSTPARSPRRRDRDVSNEIEQDGLHDLLGAG